MWRRARRCRCTPEAVAFAGHYGFVIDVLAGRVFASLTDLLAAFDTRVPLRRGQVHRTHGKRIAERAVADHAALRPLPDRPYLVSERHLRRVGKDCLISFEGSLYSVPARRVLAGQSVEVRASATAVTIHDRATAPYSRRTPARPNAGHGWSMRRTGTGFPPAAPAPPPLASRPRRPGQ